MSIVFVIHKSGRTSERVFVCQSSARDSTSMYMFDCKWHYRICHMFNKELRQDRRMIAWICLYIWLRDQKCATDFTTWISHHSIYFGMFDDSWNLTYIATQCAMRHIQTWKCCVTSETQFCSKNIYTKTKIRSSIIMPMALFALFIHFTLYTAETEFL